MSINLPNRGSFRIHKVRDYQHVDLEISWDLSKLNFEEVVGLKAGDVVRDKGLNCLAEVVKVRSFTDVELRNLKTQNVYHQNPANCELVSGLEALGEQSDD